MHLWKTLNRVDDKLWNKIGRIDYATVFSARNIYMESFMKVFILVFSLFKNDYGRGIPLLQLVSEVIYTSESLLYFCLGLSFQFSE